MAKVLITEGQDRVDIKAEYDQATIDLQTIVDYQSPDNAQVIWAVKRIARILLLLLRLVKKRVVDK